ncbi:MAG: DUF2752 domain-containing protein [Lentimicrobium sp.]
MKDKVRYGFQFLRSRFEAIAWMAGLTLMAFMAPTDSHVSLCPFNATGLGFCPGCGLGHSISWLFRGEFVQSFHAHPLGIVAVAILSWRIITIIKKPVLYH